MAALVRLRNSINKSVINVSKETAASLGAEWKPFKAGTKGSKPTDSLTGDEDKGDDTTPAEASKPSK